MKRITKKILSVMLALIFVLGSVPFSVLSEISWFPFKITVFADDDSAGYPDYSELSENQYIARILLNYNYYGSATLGDATSGTVPSEQLKYWINPNDVSAARILRNELAGNSGFMASVGAWEVLTFDPSKTADEIFDEEDYYTAILTSILDVKMKDSEFKKAWNCSTNKTILDMSKSVTKFAKEILGTDISKAESVSISDFSPEQMDKLLNEIGELKSSQSFYDATGKNISVIKDATKACNTLYDLIKTISTYSQIANLNKATETVLKEIYDNAPQGTPMKAAAKKVYEICSEQMTQAMFAQIETGEALFDIGFEAVVGKLWDVALKGIFNMFGVDGGLLTGMKIGQAVGKTLSNYCFSTDKTIEQYYVLDAVVQFEDVMVNTVNSLASKFKQGESVESADALVKAVELLFETYDLGCEYTFSFVETANSSGLVNKVRSWFKKDETVETYKKLTNSMKSSIKNIKTTLTSLEGYKWYYEVDAPTAYKKCFEPEDSNPAYSKNKEITYINISATESGGAIFDFNVNEGKTVTITNCNISASGEVSVPCEIGGCKVESIASSAFSNCKSMTTLKIGKNVKSIGNSAFYGCTGLTSIEIPSSVTYIDRYAFEGCTGLTSIEIPSSVTKIDDDAFSGCKNLSNVKLNRGLKSMGYGAFYGTAITSIKIPNTVTGMSEYNGKSVFSGATKLKSVEFEYGMLSIPSCALENCSDVTNVVIPNGVTNIDSDAFYGCTGLTSIEIPNSVTYIGRSAFEGCTKLKSIEIPESVTEIDNYAFRGCKNLSNVKMNRGLTTIGYGAFSGTAITSVKIPNTVISMRSDYGVSAFSGATKLNDVEFEYGILSIPDGALQNCSSVTKAPIPDSVTRIGEFAFEGCSGLASVKIPDDVTCIGRYAFSCCTGFSSVEIPSGVTYIDQYAFNGCENLLDVTLNRGLERLGCGAFAGTAITSIKIPNTVIVMGTNNGKSVFSGAKELKSVEFEYGMLSIPSGALQGCSSVTKVLIPNGIKRIGEFAFCWCENLTSIEMPDSLTYIDRYAFSNCKSLASVRIPDKVKNIGENAFELCLGLTSVETPESVVEINNYAFNGCENLSDVKLNRGLKLIGRGAFFGTSITSIKIPNTVIAMGTNNGNSVFSGAKKLKSVEFEYGMLSIPSYALENCSDVTNVVIPNGVTKIDSVAFYGCTGLTSIEIPDSVTSIGNSAFYGCIGLTSIEIPDSVTSIGNSAFYGCTSLTSIEIPDSVTNIGSDAFYGCTALKTLNVVENSSAHKWAVKNGYSVSFIDCSHYYKDVVVESVSGCTTRGYSYDICKTCGKKLQEYTVPEKGHSFTEATVITVPTCTAKGLKQSVCTKCGEKINTVLPLLEHQPERFGALKAPTCTEEGLQYGEKCSVCGEILKAQTVKPALGHRYGYDGICAVCGVDNAFEAESKHPYEASHDETKEIRRNGAVKVSVTFSEETKTEENCDYIYIYDKSNNLVGKYSGTQLSGKTVTVNGDTMRIRLVSDSDVNFFGYSIKKAEGIYGALIPAKDVLFDFDCNIIFTKQENVNTLDRLVTLNKSDEANSVTSIKSNNGSVFGSGSVICAFYDGVLDGVYTVALSGDLNGDGVCDVLDAMLCEKAVNGHTELKTYQKYAANGGSADGVDISSYQRTVNEALK